MDLVPAVPIPELFFSLEKLLQLGLATFVSRELQENKSHFSEEHLIKIQFHDSIVDVSYVNFDLSVSEHGLV